MNNLIPKRLQIGGRWISVKWKDLGSDLWGLWCIDTFTISLNKELIKDESSAWRTFLHEVVHASLDIGGVSFCLSDEEEESVVRNIENIFLPSLLKIIPDDLTL